MRPDAWLAWALVALSLGAHAQDSIKVHAAGSLRAALTAAGDAFAARADGARVQFEFGPSGLLKGRLEKGEASDLFASANMEHPQALTDAGRAGPVRAFARNTLCALAAPGIAVTTANLLDTILDPKVKLGISTPKADPAGDYAWQLFAKAEKSRAGAQKALEAKALQLTGGPAPASIPKDRNAYGALVAGGKADVYLTYCTNGLLAKKEEPQLQVIAIDPALNVGADYGLVVTKGAKPAAQRFADFILSADGARLLQGYGFEAPR